VIDSGGARNVVGVGEGFGRKSCSSRNGMRNVIVLRGHGGMLMVRLTGDIRSKGCVIELIGQSINPTYRLSKIPWSDTNVQLRWCKREDRSYFESLSQQKCH
jgi:hypothetical protein